MASLRNRLDAGWLDAALHLLDRQVVDAEGAMVCNVDDLELTEELKSVQAPVLVVTGEAQLERVVPVRLTHEYLDLWPQARAGTLPRTGHLGLITRPEAFARLVAPFVEETSGMPAARRRIV